MAAQRLPMIVTDISPLTEATLKLCLAAADGAALPAWQAGAHIDLHLPTASGDVIRQYSLCGDPQNDREYQVAVLRADESRGGSAFVHQGLARGARLDIGPPRNHFELQPAPSYLFIAGGIGITPLLPMIARAQADGADWALLFCARSQDNMPFGADLRAAYPDRVVLHDSARLGRADLAARIAALDPATHIYCCGPEAMIETLERIGADLGAGRIHVERFAPRDIDHTADDSFEVEFARSGHVVTIAAGQSILDVAEDLGLDIDSSCQEGTCGSCETRVISGIPDHRCSVLTAREKAENQSMMVCVSRACSKRLVLDA